jgi:L-lactate dehydrogenase (cytochrome)
MNIPYCVSTYASVSLEEIVACMSPDGKGAQHIFQLYVPVQKEKTRELNNHAKALQFAALVLTVDTAVVGKREEDERYKARLEWESGTVVPRQAQATPQAGKPILRGAHSSTLNWSDLKWIRELWGTAPFYLKGIQSFEDAQMALEAGVNGIILSNHGGRQLDFSPSSIRTLLEIRKFCPQVLDKLEVYLDGGIRRGSDVIKALCLGATAVGLGRPFMYALGAYGTEGVVRAIERKLQYPREPLPPCIVL